MLPVTVQATKLIFSRWFKPEFYWSDKRENHLERSHGIRYTSDIPFEFDSLPVPGRMLVSWRSRTAQKLSVLLENYPHKYALLRLTRK